MWCPICQQDVPGYGSADGRELRCGKCGESLQGPVGPPVPLNAVPAASSEAAVKVASQVDVKTLLRGGALDQDWALEADIRGVQRLIGALKSRSTLVAEPLAVHLAHASPGSWHVPGEPARSPNASRTAPPAVAHQPHEAPQRSSHPAAWTVLCMGVALLACGVALVVLSVISARADLWQIGLPAVVVGQAGLIIGFALQLDALGGRSSRTTTSAEAVVETTAADSPATGMRAMSDTAVASQHMLLSELKTRLDRLVQQA
jgi:hypothetical protein